MVRERHPRLSQPSRGRGRGPRGSRTSRRALAAPRGAGPGPRRPSVRRRRCLFAVQQELSRPKGRRPAFPPDYRRGDSLTSLRARPQRKGREPLSARARQPGRQGPRQLEIPDFQTAVARTRLPGAAGGRSRPRRVDEVDGDVGLSRRTAAEPGAGRMDDISGEVMPLASPKPEDAGTPVVRRGSRPAQQCCDAVGILPCIRPACLWRVAGTPAPGAHWRTSGPPGPGSVPPD